MKAAIGYPAPGWAPTNGLLSDSIATPVSTSTAMGVNAFTAGIRLIAEDLGHLPLITYRRLDKGKERAYDHPAYAMLHDSPNPEMTSMVFRETGVGHLYSWGNWYAEKELNGVGATVRLWPLRPDRMRVEIDRVSGKRVYKYRLPDGSGAILPASRVFHVPGWGFDGLIGYSRVTLMRRALESAMVAEEYGLRTLRNNSQPGVTIMHKEQLSQIAKTNIANSWDERHSGLTNAQRTAVLDEGMTIEQIGFSPEDSQFYEGRVLSVIEVARGLRLAPHKLSDLTNAHFTNIEESNIDHVVGTLGPPATRIEQQIGKDILADPRYFTEHLFEKLMRGKTLDRFNAYRIASNGAAWLNADDIAEMENRNPLPDGAGQIYLAPLNMTPVELLAEASMNGKDEPQPETKAPVDPTPVEDMVTGIKAAIRSMAEPAEAPIVNVEAPEVHVHTDSFVEAIEDLRVMLAAPKVRRIERDKNGRIVSVVEG